jgi:prophage antirepressor-like protein
VKVTIDRVVLTNVSVREQDAEAFRGAVTTELSRLIEKHGLPALASASSVNVPLRSGNDLAADVAASLYTALRGRG